MKINPPVLSQSRCLLSLQTAVELVDCHQREKISEIQQSNKIFTLFLIYAAFSSSWNVRPKHGENQHYSAPAIHCSQFQLKGFTWFTAFSPFSASSVSSYFVSQTYKKSYMCPSLWVFKHLTCLLAFYLLLNINSKITQFRVVQIKSFCTLPSTLMLTETSHKCNGMQKRSSVGKNIRNDFHTYGP